MLSMRWVRGRVGILLCVAFVAGCSPFKDASQGESGAARTQSADSTGPLQWTRTGSLFADVFFDEGVGTSVGISGDTVIVGAPADGNDRQGSASVRSGAAYVYVAGTSPAWTLEQKLLPPDAVDGDAFGTSVAVSGDTAVVGAYRDALDFGSPQGAAYVFVRSGGSWTFQQKLTAPEAAIDAGFGSAVGIDGDQIVVGAPSDAPGGVQSGAAYAFSRSSGVWTETQMLTPITPTSGAKFGAQLALSAGRALIGAAGAPSGGAATTFLFSGSAWAVEQELHAPVTGYKFGTAVALDGDRALVGDPAWMNYLSTYKYNYGVVYSFSRGSTTWSADGKFTVTPTTNNPDVIGKAIALSGTQAYVAQNKSAGFGFDSLFTFTAGTTTTAQYASKSLGNLTAALAASGSRFVVGAPWGSGSAAAGTLATNLVGLTSAVSYYLAAGAVIDDEDAFLSVYSSGAVPASGMLLPYENPTNTQLGDVDVGSHLFDKFSLSSDTLLTPVYGLYATDRGYAVFYARNHGELSSPQTITGLTSTFPDSQALLGDIALLGSTGNYVEVVQHSGSTWSETEKLQLDGSDKGFGSAVALSADTAFVAGSAGIYVYARYGSIFALIQILTPPTSDAADGFGRSLAFAGDSLFVASTHLLTVYQRSGGAWAQTQVLAAPASMLQPLLVMAAGDSAFMYTKYEIQVSTAAYRYDGSAWNFTQLLNLSPLAMTSTRALFSVPAIHGRACVGVFDLIPPVVCGDGVIGPGEQCDDSNTTSGDGCSSSCQTESGSGGTGGGGGSGTAGMGGIGAGAGGASASGMGGVAGGSGLGGASAGLGGVDTGGTTAGLSGDTGGTSTGLGGSSAGGTDPGVGGAGVSGDAGVAGGGQAGLGGENGAGAGGAGGIVGSSGGTSGDTSTAGMTTTGGSSSSGGSASSDAGTGGTGGVTSTGGTVGTSSGGDGTGGIDLAGGNGGAAGEAGAQPSAGGTSASASGGGTAQAGAGGSVTSGSGGSSDGGHAVGGSDATSGAAGEAAPSAGQPNAERGGASASGGHGGTSASGGHGGTSGGLASGAASGDGTPSDTGCSCTIPGRNGAPPSSAPFGALTLALLAASRLRRTYGRRLLA